MAEHAAVAVVVAARDAEATLGAAVRSALTQPEVAQVVVVDDASADGTARAAAALAAGDDRVEVRTRGARGGPSVARDDGLAAVRHPRVLFLDADDRLLEGAVGALADALTATPGATVAMGRFAPVDAAGDPAAAGRWHDDQLHPVVRRGGRLVASPEGLSPEALVTRLVSPPPGAWLCDADAVRAVGGFDAGVSRSEDLELLVRLASAGRVVATDRDVLSYRRHGAQRSAARARRRWGRGGALWAMLRAAPSSADGRALARGMVAYHLALAGDRRSGSWRVRAMGLRNLLAAGAVVAAAPLALALPRRLPRPLEGPVD